MKKEAKVDLKTIIPILVLICAFFVIVYAASTVEFSSMEGNLTVFYTSENMIYNNTMLVFNITADPDDMGVNITNVTILLNSSLFAYVPDSNYTDADYFNFSNTTGGGYLILTWNITEGTFGNGSLFGFVFNITPRSEVEVLNSPIIVRATNMSGNDEFIINDSTSFTVNVDSKKPSVIFITVNNTNISTVTNVVLNFSIIDIHNDTCKLYLWNGTDSKELVENKTAANVSGIGFFYNFTGGDGDYEWSVWCNDTLGNYNYTDVNYTITIDRVPPHTEGCMFNITNATGEPRWNSTSFSTDNVSILNLESNEADVSVGVRQGDTITAWFNFTDNTTGLYAVRLEVYNSTLNDWMNLSWRETGLLSDGTLYTLNYTFCTDVDCYQSGTNVSIRVGAKDYVGNINSSRNLTVQVNDTAGPEITGCTINGVNASATTVVNVSNTKFRLNWTINERNNLTWVYYVIDGSTAPTHSHNYTWDDVGDSSSGSYLERDRLKTGSVHPSAKSTSELPTGTGASSYLANGTHGVELIVMDNWGNNKSAYCNFTIDLQAPSMLLSFNGTVISTPSPKAYPVNLSLETWMQVNVTKNLKSGLATLEYYTTCNTTPKTIYNSTAFQPFNESACQNYAQTVNITITATSGSGIENTTTFELGLDDVDPVVTLNSINGDTSYNGAEFARGNISLNLSVTEWTDISSFGYYLDGNNYVEFDGGILYHGMSYENVTNMTYGGTHTLILQANDSVGNAGNSSAYTFTVIEPVNIATKGEELEAYLNQTGDAIDVNITFINGTYVDGEEIINNSNKKINLSIHIQLNTSLGMNITIDGINASKIVWRYINFSVTGDSVETKEHIQNNYSADVLAMVRFNKSIDNFIPDQNAYYGRVMVDYNLTPYNQTINQLIGMWFANETDYTNRTVLSACDGAGETTSYLPTSTTACYNVTSNVATTIFVPHFSTVVVVNDTNASTVTVVTPTLDKTGYNSSSFKINLTVSGDVSSCAFKINVSGYNGSSAADFSAGWTEMTVSGTSPKTCLSPAVISLLNSTGFGYNLSLNVTDASGNQYINTTVFNITDTLPPNYSNVTNRSIGSTTVTIRVESNEYVNASVTHGSGTVFGQSSPFTTYTPTISLTGLDSSTLINYTVNVCDYAGNCNRTSPYNFTTSAAAAAAAATTTGGGTSGGVGYQITASNEKASTSHMWSSVSSGESVTMNVVNPNIGITNVEVNVKNTVANAKIRIASLKTKPADLTVAATTVYQYLQITPTNLKDADITRATIKFKVSKSWLTDNGVAEDDVVLLRYADNAWSTLVTTKVSTDGSYAYYEATTTGFSYYAIGAGVGGAAFEIIDAIRAFYDGTSTLTAFDIIDKIRAFYGG